MRAEEAIAFARALQEEVDRGADARAAQIQRQGLTLACGRGCCDCCEEPVMVYRPESLAVAAWLELPEQAAVRDAFVAAYPAWKERAGDTPARLSALTGQKGYLAAHIEGWRKRVLCAFNQNGDCTIYPVRPITCRNAHALDTSDRCNGSSPLPAARVTFVPLDSFITRTRPALAEAHDAAGGPEGRLEALCDVVHEKLGR